MKTRLAMLVGIVAVGIMAVGILAVASTIAPAEAARRSAAPEARVICGQTGCFNVPPGCRGELRPSGKGDNVVAVVICRR